MKKFYICIFALVFVLSLAGCTKVLKPVIEEPSTSEPTEDEVTEKEELVPLLFADEKENLYLYGIKPDGVILYADGIGHFYDWEYDCSDYRAPKIFSGYFDNDTSYEDLAVVTYTKNDGVSVEDIRFITDGDFEADDVYLVDSSELDSYVSYYVSESFSNNAVIFTYDGTSYSFDLSDCFSTLAYDGVSYSENVSYELVDGKIYVNIVPVVSSADDEGDYGKAEVDLTVKAKLNFDGYNISLSDFELKLTGI
jgi:hypothetical protein